MKITFGICTYNRKDIIELTSKSLHNIKGIESVNVRIYDDCSDEYDINTLRMLYPYAKSIIPSEINLGADGNIRRMYEDFLRHDDDFFFNADSDLIFNQNILEVIEKIVVDIGSNPLVVSLFNTKTHIAVGKEKEYLIKEDIGSAGTLMNRKAVQMIVDKVTDSNLDFGWCKLFNQNGIPIYCTKQSYLQHIGVSGENTTSANFDWGMGFRIDSISNAEGIQYAVERMDFSTPLQTRLVDLASEGKVKIKTIILMGMRLLKYHLKKKKGKKQ